ncbi:anti-sigma factor family protein [Bacillus sp. SD088]|uniref:anti-sigma factor family protein n=1 Tax=Bacillus sp. SD088 TaxID=2782012 RepID=UPI001A9576D0|nr:hypothetical protein [Bacillus sp. SD088]MBO0992506.1 hypothetical protein [Bacillus sp. SD088]
MNHYSVENWLQYVRDELEEETRTQYENHLYHCDHCLELYLQAVETNDAQELDLSETENFTDSIMEQIAEIKNPVQCGQKKKRMLHLRKQTFIHYTVAVAMTMILMSTGVFSQLMRMASTVESNESRHTESFIQSFLDQQGSIINKFEMDIHIKEGKQK